MLPKRNDRTLGTYFRGPYWQGNIDRINKATTADIATLREALSGETAKARPRKRLVAKLTAAIAKLESL